ncbi:MAG: hypothetical protein Kow0037_07390 [Calditrichia bacterium]
MLFEEGFTLSDFEIKKKVAGEFQISPEALDSVYLRIRYWQYKTGHSRLGIVKFPNTPQNK